MAESLNKIDSHDVIETGYNIDERLNKKKVKKFRDSYVKAINKIINHV